MAINRTIETFEMILSEQSLGPAETPDPLNPNNMTLRWGKKITRKDSARPEEDNEFHKIVSINDPTRIWRLLRKAMGKAQGDPDGLPDLGKLDPDND